MPLSAAMYTESLQGEISANQFAPTFLQLDYVATGNVPGSNVVTGAVGRSATGVTDRDYLWVNVPAGHRLSELRVGNQTMVGGNGSFIGVAAGATMPVSPTAPDATGLLGWKLYSLTDLTTNILDDMAVPTQGSSGFAGVLGAGDYTFWIQELAAGSYNYRFNFILEPTPVPLPAGMWLLAAGLVALGGMRRKHAALPAYSTSA
jgi:hypothetical protein